MRPQRADDDQGGSESGCRRSFRYWMMLRDARKTGFPKAAANPSNILFFRQNQGHAPVKHAGGLPVLCGPWWSPPTGRAKKIPSPSPAKAISHAAFARFTRIAVAHACLVIKSRNEHGAANPVAKSRSRRRRRSRISSVPQWSVRGAQSRSRSRQRVANSPSLSAAVADVFVLVRKCGARPLCCRLYSANHLVRDPMERRVRLTAAVRRWASCARLAAHPPAYRIVGAARVDWLLSLQHHGLLRPTFYDRDQRIVAAIGRAPVRRVVVIHLVSRSSVGAPSHRHLAVTRRRHCHCLPWQPRSSIGNRLQPRRPVVRRRAADLRLLRGHAESPAANTPVVVPRRRYGRWRDFTLAGDGARDCRRTNDGARYHYCVEPALRLRISIAARIFVSQPRN